jgi:ATP adenylyltransferase
MAFIQGEKPTGCIFCLKPKEGNDRANYILARGRHNFVMLNASPYTTGHLMVVPYAHVASIEDLPPEAAAEMMALAKHAVSVLRRAEKATAFNVGINIGKAAGAGIADHVHLHVVPRWEGDSNFMPVIGDTRLLPETLDTTYAKLSRAGIATLPEGQSD